MVHKPPFVLHLSSRLSCAIHCVYPFHFSRFMWMLRFRFGIGKVWWYRVWSWMAWEGSLHKRHIQACIIPLRTVSPCAGSAARIFRKVEEMRREPMAGKAFYCALIFISICSQLMRRFTEARDWNFLYWQMARNDVWGDHLCQIIFCQNLWFSLVKVLSTSISDASCHFD